MHIQKVVFFSIDSYSFFFLDQAANKYITVVEKSINLLLVIKMEKFI